MAQGGKADLAKATDRDDAHALIIIIIIIRRRRRRRNKGNKHDNINHSINTYMIIHDNNSENTIRKRPTHA